MPSVTVKTKYVSQEGYQTLQAGQPMTQMSFNHEIIVNRTTLLRFSGINIPKGATVTAAGLRLYVSAKNKGTYQTVGWQVKIDDNNNSPRLVAGRDEIYTRNWHTNAATNGFGWTANGPDRQQVYMPIDVGPLNTKFARSDWTEYSPMTFYVLWTQGPASGQQMFVHGTYDGWAPELIVTYNEPASDGKQVAVNEIENAAFTDGITPWHFNSFFGVFTQPTYSIVTSPAPPVNPTKTKTLAITSTGGKPMVLHDAPRDLVPGWWYTFSAYVYVPSNITSNIRVHLLNEPGPATLMSTDVKNQWVRLHVKFLVGDSVSYIAVSSISDIPSGGVFYVANTQLTRGDYLRPYFDGDSVISGGTYNWTSPGGLSIGKATPPTVTIPTSQEDASYYREKRVEWNYNAGSSGNQYSVRLDW